MSANQQQRIKRTLLRLFIGERLLVFRAGLHLLQVNTHFWRRNQELFPDSQALPFNHPRIVLCRLTIRRSKHNPVLGGQNLPRDARFTGIKVDARQWHQDGGHQFFPFQQRTRALPATAMQMCQASETRSAAYLAAFPRGVNHAATATNAAL